jgi:hypothetical protein
MSLSVRVNKYLCEQQEMKLGRETCHGLPNESSRQFLWTRLVLPNGRTCRAMRPQRGEARQKSHDTGRPRPIRSVPIRLPTPRLANPKPTITPHQPHLQRLPPMRSRRHQRKGPHGSLPGKRRRTVKRSRIGARNCQKRLFIRGMRAGLSYVENLWKSCE